MSPAAPTSIQFGGEVAPRGDPRPLARSAAASCRGTRPCPTSATSPFSTTSSYRGPASLHPQAWTTSPRWMITVAAPDPRSKWHIRHGYVVGKDFFSGERKRSMIQMLPHVNRPLGSGHGCRPVEVIARSGTQVAVIECPRYDLIGRLPRPSSSTSSWESRSCRIQNL